MEAVMAVAAYGFQFPEELVSDMLVGEVMDLCCHVEPAALALIFGSSQDYGAKPLPFRAVEIFVVMSPPV